MASSALRGSSEFSIEDFLDAEQAKDLLRFTTAGSVDDGKSTLIGRLLYDSQQRLRRSHPRRHRRPASTGAQPAPSTSPSSPTACAPSASRASPSTSPTATFRTAAPQVHHRRHTRPRAVHAQHGHRRIHRRPRHHPHRRAQRRPHAVAPPRLHRLAARHPSPRRRRQQDGPGRLFKEVFHSLARDLQQLAEKLGIADLITIPVSALHGDNVVDPSLNTPWYNGPTLLDIWRPCPPGMTSTALPFVYPSSASFAPTSTIAASPDRLPPAPSGQATPSSRSPPAEPAA